MNYSVREMNHLLDAQTEIASEPPILLTPEQKIQALESQLAAATEEIKKLTEANEKLKELARIDELTGLRNRRSFDEEIIKEILNAVRTKRDLTVVIIDVDKFKEVNDSHGHLTGDTVLEEVAKRLKKPLRLTDPVYRTGGDEFAVILPETDQSQANEVALRLLRAVNQHRVIANDSQEIAITCSIGVGLFKPQDSDLPRKIEPQLILPIVKELINQADQNMYEAKRAGRNSVGSILSDGSTQIKTI